MNKRLLSVMLLALMGVTIASCSINPSSSSSVEESSSASSEESSSEPSSSEVVLSAITISGADDIELDFEATFNALTGVTAVGNNSVDYTSSIVLQSTSQAVNLTTGAVDTTATGIHAIRYTVTVGTVTAQKWRYVTVKSPVAPEGQMLINPDFSLGTAGWDNPSVVYIADGAAMVLSTEDGALKAEVVSGSNAYTPRFGQMNVPFKNATTYEVSFDAKSSVTKIINLQVGELLSAAPWFTDFKVNQVVHKTITTEWATYSYKFTHTQENERGGLLFELGTVENQDIDATLWFDNVAIEESTQDADTTPPVFSGVSESVNVTVGSAYDPMAGVTALDFPDGDVTADIVVTIANEGGSPVESVDTSVPGVFTVTYTVEDAAGNVETKTTTVNVVSMLFKETNLIANPSFEQPLNETTPEWAHWHQDGYWGQPAPVVEYNLDNTAGTYSVGIVGGGDAAWSVQLFQDNYITLEQGKTYRLQVDAYATVARSMNVALGYGSWVEYGRKDGVAIGTTSDTYEYVFTVTKETHAVKFVIELGAQPGFADGTVVFEEIRLQEHDSAPIIEDSAFAAAGWRGFYNFWEGSAATYGIVNGEYKIDITTYNNTGNEWALQLIQDDMSLGGTTEAGVIELTAGATYTIGFDAYATEAMNIHPYIISSSDWANLVTEAQRTVAITTTKTHYEVTATAGATVYGNEILKFQFGDMASFADVTKSVMFDNITVKDSTNANLASVYNGDMETILGNHSFYSPSVNNTMKRSDDGAVFNIVDLGGAAYEPHYYYIIDSLEAGNYAAAFTLTSSVARDFRFNIILPDAGYASILPDTKYDFHLDAGVETQIVIPFTVSNMLTNVKVELDFGTIGDPLISAATVVTMKNILVYRDYNAA